MISQRVEVLLLCFNNYQVQLVTLCIVLNTDLLPLVRVSLNTHASVLCQTMECDSIICVTYNPGHLMVHEIF